MRIKLQKEHPITFFVRIKGPHGARELRAILDTGCALCSLPTTDARELGYQAFFDPVSDKGEGLYTLTHTGIVEAGPLVLEELTVGDLAARNVAAVAWNLPRLGGIDVILGLSFLNRFKTIVDYNTGYLVIE